MLVQRQNIRTLMMAYNNGITAGGLGPNTPNGIKYRQFLDALTQARAIVTTSWPIPTKLAYYKDGGYYDVAKLHGYESGPSALVPPPPCPHNDITFLPWHRAYILKLERKLQIITGDPSFALPYWDWTTTIWQDLCNAKQYISLGYQSVGVNAPVNSLQLNPLYSTPVPTTSPTREDCTAQRPTASLYTSPLFPKIRRIYKSPASRSLYLSNIQTNVDKVMCANSFVHKNDFGLNAQTQPANFSFTVRFGSPHDDIHLQIVAGDMAMAAYASYDPLFWLHHANVDRIWVSWQANNPSAPVMQPSATQTQTDLNNYLSTPLMFGGTHCETVSSVMDIARLDYRYDQLIGPKPCPPPPQGKMALWIISISLRMDANIDVFFNLSQEQINNINNLPVDIPNYAGTVSVFGINTHMNGMSSKNIHRFTDVTEAFRRFGANPNQIKVTLRAKNTDGIFIPASGWDFKATLFEKS
jgi:Common central domain of tyrosinase